MGLVLIWNVVTANWCGKILSQLFCFYTDRQIATAYVGATAGAGFASIGLNSLLVSFLLVHCHYLCAHLIAGSSNTTEALDTTGSYDSDQLYQHSHHETKVMIKDPEIALLYIVSTGSLLMG